eukprot:1004242-Rhodomonas_salina.1
MTRMKPRDSLSDPDRGSLTRDSETLRVREPTRTSLPTDTQLERNTTANASRARPVHCQASLFQLEDSIVPRTPARIELGFRKSALASIVRQLAAA